MNIPSIQSLKDALAQSGKNIADWKAYYQNQQIIKTITDDPETEDSFVELCEALQLEAKETAFIVLAPITFLHLNDFLNGVKMATTAFCFLRNGHVVTEEALNITDGSYAKAYNEILKRTVGYDIEGIIPAVSESDIVTETVEQLIQKSNQFWESIDAWIKKFAALPAVKSAERYKRDSENDVDRLVLITVKGNYPDDINADDWFILELNNTFGSPDWGYNEVYSETYEKWSECLNTIKTWEDLYDQLVELSSLYTHVPQLR